MRCWLYSHDSVGLGSLRRQLAIAAALAALAPAARVWLTTSLDEGARFRVPANCEIIKLPAVRAVALRTAKLDEIARTFRPDVLLVDKHPFGLDGELSSPIAIVKRHGAHLILGLRDILDDREAVLKKWLPSDIQKQVVRSYDRVLIYGSASIFDATKEYQFSVPLRKRTVFCGYVVNGDDLDSLSAGSASSGNNKSPLVIGTAGGGADGFDLLKVFVEAAASETWHGAVVAGPLLDARGCRALRRLAQGKGVAFRRFNAHLSPVFSRASTMVGMGGYNTLAEALSRGVSVVCVPRTRPRSEQLLRASLFERQGLLRLIRPDDLNVKALHSAIEEALQVPRSRVLARVHSQLQFDGALHAAKEILNHQYAG